MDETEEALPGSPSSAWPEEDETAPEMPYTLASRQSADEAAEEKALPGSPSSAWPEWSEPAEEDVPAGAADEEPEVKLNKAEASSNVKFEMPSQETRGGSKMMQALGLEDAAVMDVKKAEDENTDTPLKSAQEARLKGELEDTLFADDTRTGAGLVTKQQDDQYKDWPEYDPTSPASDGNEPEGANQTTELAYRVDEGAPTAATAARRQKKPVGPCPVLLVGSKLSKECLLKPGRWVEVGRHVKATVLMQNPAVSKHHCKLQWKKGSRSVHLRVLDGVTYVNNERLESGSDATLKHGDLIKVNGKGVSYRMLVNLKPINEILPNVQSTDNYAAACKEALPSSTNTEEETRRRIRKLRAAAAAARTKSMECEERLITIQSNRAVCYKKMQDDAERSRQFVKDESKLSDLLMKSRDDWLDRLHQQSEENHEAGAPLNEMTATTQNKLDELTKLKARYDREVNPDRHLGHMSLDHNVPPSPARSGSAASPRKPANKFAAVAGEADGEDEAFAGGVSKRVLEDEKLEFVKPTIEVLKAPIGANDDIADLFGDFDSDAEEEGESNAKRLRVE